LLRWTGCSKVVARIFLFVNKIFSGIAYYLEDKVGDKSSSQIYRCKLRMQVANLGIKHHKTPYYLNSI